jgi:hypothetical protein
MNRRFLLLAPLALAIAGAGWWLARPPPPSDEQLIRALFEEGARAAEERRVSDAVAGLSERFSGQGLTRRELKQLVAAQTMGGRWLVIRIAGLRVEVAGDRARALLDLVASRAGAGKAVADLLPADGDAWRVDCRLEREPEGWRVVGASWVAESLAEALAGPEPGGAPGPGDAAPPR